MQFIQKNIEKHGIYPLFVPLQYPEDTEESLNQPDRIDVEEFDYNKAEALIDSIILGKEKRREDLRKTNAILRKTAEKNADYAIELLSK